MKVGFTGSRAGMTDGQFAAVRKLLQHAQPLQPAYERFTVHHGDCIGADAQAHDIARTFTNAQIVIHPPTNSQARAFCTATYTREPRPYLARNRAIVDETDELIAAPKQTAEPSDPLEGGGTWATVRYARRQGKRVHIVWPDGNVTLEERQGKR